MAGVSIKDRLLHRVERARWARHAATATTTRISELSGRETAALLLRKEIDDFLAIAGDRLALPRIGSNAIMRPPGTDWAWRPEIWRGPLAQKGFVALESRGALGDEVTLFHDCTISELTLRQIRNNSRDDLAPFGLQMDVFRFDGSFLSLAINCPTAATEGLRKRHLVRLDAVIETEKPLEIFARLNIQHGPNTEKIVRELDLSGRNVMVEFDLAYTKLNEKRVDKMWLDLIFEGPQMNQVTLRDVTLCRLPRAEL